MQSKTGLVEYNFDASPVMVVPSDWNTKNPRLFFYEGSVYVEKGIALIIPGFTPDVLGQIYVYVPSMTEIKTAAMIFSFGFLLFTFMVKIAVAIIFKDYNIHSLSRKKTVQNIQAQG